MGKRAFQHQEGILEDKYESPAGEPHIYQAASQLLGEQITDTQRERALSKIRALADHKEHIRPLLRTMGEPISTPELQAAAVAYAEYQSAVYSLSGDTSDEFVEALLISLEAGCLGAPFTLLAFLDDHPKVQPAIAMALREVPVTHVAFVAEVAGRIGGTEMIALLETWLAQLITAPETFVEVPYFNPKATSLCATAKALLQLSTDHTDAANALVKLFSHPSETDQKSAFQAAAEFYRKGADLAANRIIGPALRPFLESKDNALFLLLAPAFVLTESSSVFERCRNMLHEKEHTIRDQLFSALQQFPGYFAAKVVRLLREWLPHEKDLRLSIEIACFLGDLAPQKTRKQLATSGLAHESPSLRKLVIMGLLPSLSNTTAQTLAAEALPDEPDALLRKKLREHISDDAEKNSSHESTNL